MSKLPQVHPRQREGVPDPDHRYDILDDAADEGDDENPGETVEEDFQML